MTMSLPQQPSRLRGTPARARSEKRAQTSLRWRWLAVIATCWSLIPLAAINNLAAQDQIEIKAADTSSPRATLQGFIDSFNELGDLVSASKALARNDPRLAVPAVRILDCLDVRDLPAFASEQRAGEVAVCIKEILDREEMPDFDEIPDAQGINLPNGEKLAAWRIPGTRLTIARVEDGRQKHEYLFSPGTVDRAVSYYQNIKDLPYRTIGPATTPGLYEWYMSNPGHPAIAQLLSSLPPSWRSSRIFGLATWKWVGLLLLIPISVALMFAAYRAQIAIAGRARQKSVFAYCLTLVFPIVAMLVPFAFDHITESYLALRGNPLYVSGFVSILVGLVATTVVIFSTSRRVAELVIDSPRINPLGFNAQLIRVVSRMLSLAATVVLFLVGGQYLGIPIGTLLASAGIGGVAVALGAQDTLKGLFGTLAIMADRPFRVGDRVVLGQYDGFVEDIGLRSTKVRLLTGNQVLLPNDHVARQDIENVGRRTYIRRSSRVRLPLDTPCGQVERAVAIIRDCLQGHEELDPEKPARVFFDDFETDCFSIAFIYWYRAPDYWEFKAFGDRVNFEIFRAFEAESIQFSLPRRHSYWKDENHRGPIDVALVDSRQAGGR